MLQRSGQLTVPVSLSDPAMGATYRRGMEPRRTLISRGRRRRLAEELEEEGLGFVVEQPSDDALLEELDYALRPPVHERRVPSYGVILHPTVEPAAWTATTELTVDRRPTVEFGDAQVRRFADGFSSWAVRRAHGLDELIVFDRPAGSERDLVVVSAACGGRIVQRHPSGLVRIVGPFGVVRRELTGWHHEPPLGVWLDEIPGCHETGSLTMLGRLVDFAVHDLGARGIGALLVHHPTGVLAVAHEQRLPVPPELHIDRPHDLAPLRHALAQTDGASVFDAGGTLRLMGVRLVPSREAEEAVRALGGTRHTSARRYSYDDPDSMVVVVSEDGPVTVLHAGEIIGRSPAD